MRVTDVLDESRIVFVEAQASRTALLRSALEPIAGREGVGDVEAVVTALMERERLCSTAIGGGYAIPHTFAPAIARLLVALVVPSQPVDFRSLDGRPVEFLFLILGPPEEQKRHLGLLSRLSRILNAPALLDQLRAARRDKGALMDCLRSAETAYEARFGV